MSALSEANNRLQGVTMERDRALAQRDGLLAALEEVTEFLSRGRCRCSVAEIESGHHVDCWKPDVGEAAVRARAAIAACRGGA